MCILQLYWNLKTGVYQDSACLCVRVMYFFCMIESLFFYVLPAALNFMKSRAVFRYNLYCHGSIWTQFITIILNCRSRSRPVLISLTFQLQSSFLSSTTKYFTRSTSLSGCSSNASFNVNWLDDRFLCSCPLRNANLPNRNTIVFNSAVEKDPKASLSSRI